MNHRIKIPSVRSSTRFLGAVRNNPFLWDANAHRRKTALRQKSIKTALEDGEVFDVNLFFGPERPRIAVARLYCARSEKLDQDSNKAGILDNRARSNHVQDKTLALLSVRIDAENAPDGKAAIPENSPKRNSFFFTAIVPMVIYPNCQPE